MSIDIVKVESHKQLKKFVTFPLHLYKNCPNWVPALEGDEYDTFNPEKNGAYDFCEADCFLAYRGNDIVGRVAAIINHKADDAENIVRFGWLDFIEEEEVLRALIDTVADWGKQRGRTEMRGPWGFTDMDKEGLLVEGYEHLSPFTCLYNYPYYGEMLERTGFTKDVDWTQRTLEVSKELPSMFQFANLIEKRFKVHVVQPRSMKDMANRYGMEIFHMYNEAFAPLNGFSPLTDKQIDAYLKTYVPILDKDFVALAVNADDKPVGFVFCVPSLSKAVKKSNGRLFPFGFINILKALKKNDTLEALIMGVMPEYQQCGIPVLLFKYLHENCIKRGIDTIVMNPQLEENYKVQSLFGDYKTEPFMRRRAYKKTLGQ
ncbi:MAG: N-acetyltransferase [Bacteroidales bacterium]|nr:N-acetyltransferase [Bacteroidales bacterium]